MASPPTASGVAEITPCCRATCYELGCIGNTTSCLLELSASKGSIRGACGEVGHKRSVKKRKNADPAHEVLGYERLPLNAIFRPEAAVIGATDRPGSVGRTIMWNLISNMSFGELA